MPDFRRFWMPGEAYFFRVNLLEWRLDTLVRFVGVLRRRCGDATERPFHIDAWVVLPDHMHCIWTLPSGDDDKSNRGKAIKFCFVRALPRTERRSKVRVAKGERVIWQRLFWEHTIRNETDYAQHMVYVYSNPVKHRLAQQAVDLAYASFHHSVRLVIQSDNWAGEVDTEFEADENRRRK